MEVLHRFITAVAALLITALLVACIAQAVQANKEGYEASTQEANSLDIRERNPDRTMDNGEEIADPYQ